MSPLELFPPVWKSLVCTWKRNIIQVREFWNLLVWSRKLLIHKVCLFNMTWGVKNNHLVWYRVWHSELTFRNWYTGSYFLFNFFKKEAVKLLLDNFFCTHANPKNQNRNWSLTSGLTGKMFIMTWGVKNNHLVWYRDMELSVWHSELTFRNWYTGSYFLFNFFKKEAVKLLLDNFFWRPCESEESESELELDFRFDRKLPMSRLLTFRP